MDGIGKTSLLVAAMRAAESQREESQRLFYDPFAEDLAGPEGLALRLQAIAESGDQPAIAVRTQFIDQKINDAVAKGFRQIVILAAGMDSRAYRMSFPNGTQIFELDRQEVLDYKRKKLGSARPQCQHTTLAVDLRQDWQDQLRKSGFDPKVQTLWLVEGLVMYLEEAQVVSLFQKINSLALKEDFLLMDILGQNLLKAPHMQKQLQFLAGMGAPWLFGVDQPEVFLENLGWRAEAIQPGDFNPQRWPFPVAPRHLENVPRSFFVKAEKF